jgi:DNA polymerase-3 subunit epsilon
MKKIMVGFDLETIDSFDKEGDDKHLGEIGAVKYVYENGCFTPIAIYNKVISEGAPVAEEAEEYTGISQKLVDEHGYPLELAIYEFKEFIQDADFLMSHNGDRFDIPVIKHAFDRAGVEYIEKPNLDTMICVNYPKNCKSRNLTYLQAFHGFVNPYPHRAFADVMAMVKVLEHYDVEEAMSVALSPTVEYVAQFDYPKEKSFPTRAAYQKAMEDFTKTKDKVKSLGFNWEASRKVWSYKGKKKLYENNILPQMPCAAKLITKEKTNGKINDY